MKQLVSQTYQTIALALAVAGLVWGTAAQATMITSFTYTYNAGGNVPDASYPDSSFTKLNDNNLASSDFHNADWVGTHATANDTTTAPEVDITFDQGYRLDRLTITYLSDLRSSIFAPTELKLSFSSDGGITFPTTLTFPGTDFPDTALDNPTVESVTLDLGVGGVNADYVKASFYNDHPTAAWGFLSELDFEQIPEPGTVALLAIGGGLIWLRRRSRPIGRKQVTGHTHRLIASALALTGFVWATTSARATINVVAWYKLGEADSIVSYPNGATPTVDSSANGYDLTKYGSPTYSADTSPLAMGSTLSMQFHGSTGGDSYAYSTPVTTATSDVAFEVWAKPVNALAPYTFSYVAYNGYEGQNGYGFIQGGTGSAAAAGVGAAQDNEWYAYLGANFIDLGPVTANQWVHLGLAFDASGNVSVYRDGVFLSSDGTAVTPGPIVGFGFEIGANYLHGQNFAGEIDQVRVFTFDGTFNPGDFLYTVPEPSVGLLLIGGGLLLWSRRRR